MSFFDDRPPPLPQREPEPERPVWAGPPRGVLPGYSHQQVIVFRTERACLVLGRFLAYPTGVEFTLTLLLRDDDHHFGPPWELHRPPEPGAALPDEFLRLGFLLPDGTKWTNYGHRLPSLEEPEPPLILPQGGGGGGDRWRYRFWMWPLPPDGPLTVFAAWPAHGVAETSVVVDGGDIRRAAADAQEIWPD